MKTRRECKSVQHALCALALLATATSAVLAEQPDKFVPYVEATGSQYVDTGITGRYGTKAECKVAWLELNDRAFLDCGDWSNNTRFFMCHCSSTSGQMFVGYRTGTNVHKTYDLLFETKRVYTYTVDVSAPDGDNNSTVTVTIDGTTADAIVKQSLDTGLNLYIFANNRNGSVTGSSKTRCYGLKIWQDGTLVRDFQPCVKGNRAGLYDAVSETIFYSASGTDLVYDTNCDVPDAYIDYVESLGNSYIDTGVVSGPGVKAEAVAAWMDPSIDSALLGARNGSGRPTTSSIISAGADFTVELGNFFWAPFPCSVGVSASWLGGPYFKTLAESSEEGRKPYSIGLVFSLDI